MGFATPQPSEMEDYPHWVMNLMGINLYTQRAQKSREIEVYAKDGTLLFKGKGIGKIVVGSH